MKHTSLLFLHLMLFLHASCSHTTLSANHSSGGNLAQDLVDADQVATQVDQTAVQIDQAATQATTTLDILNSFLTVFGNAIQNTIAFLMNCIHTITGSSAATNPPTQEQIQKMLIIRNRSKDTDSSSRKEKILAHVARIVSNIFNIVKDPHNAYNVGDSVAGMVHSIINITVDAIKEKQLNPADKNAVRAHLTGIHQEIEKQIALLIAIQEGEFLCSARQ